MDAETETLIPTTGGHFSCEPIALAENTIGRKPENGGNGVGFTEGGPMYTLNATGVHGVAQAIPIDTMNMTPGHSSGGLGFGQPGDPSFTLTKGHSHAVAFEENFHAIREVDIAPAITTEGYRVSQNAGGLGLRTAMQVRRLTCVECERLQGFPDNYTNIKDKCPDGPRYKALGNSWAVPVVRWIGERIANEVA